MGELKVPDGALWGAQTQRAVDNFPVSGLSLPRGFIRALGLVKWSAAKANEELGMLEPDVAQVVRDASERVASGSCDEHFPIDVFQTGSGTSSNMNANEVIAHLASDKLGRQVHPNDHVNMGQSSNDVIPTAIHVSAALGVSETLVPALEHLAAAIDIKISQCGEVVKTGRTHLMDAMPVTFAQEMGGWAAQVRGGVDRLQSTLPRLTRLAQGGTAVGTGINAHPEFGFGFAEALSGKTHLDFKPNGDYFESLSCQDTAVELSGQLKTIAVSIMPGKVNPVIPESAAMVAAQVIGNDSTITIAGQSGNFQLNVMLPVIAHNLIQSIEILAATARLLADKAISGFEINEDRLQQALDRNPILVTALNPVIGYEKGAATAKKAYAEGRPIREVAKEMTDLSEEELMRLLDPVALTRGGIQK
jgi:fumarate hydratase class II